MLVVFDTEYTAWEGSRECGWTRPGEHREIVQIGAVRLNPMRDWAVDGSLDVIVRPHLNPDLSDYFKNLTGISQERVDREGTDLALALDQFRDFGGKDAVFVSNGRDSEVFMENCRLVGVSNPLAGLAMDVSHHFMAALGREFMVNSYALPEAFGLKLDLPAHNALGDAQAVAAALIHLHRNGKLNLHHLTARP